MRTEFHPVERCVQSSRMNQTILLRSEWNTIAAVDGILLRQWMEYYFGVKSPLLRQGRKAAAHLRPHPYLLFSPDLFTLLQKNLWRYNLFALPLQPKQRLRAL